MAKHCLVVGIAGATCSGKSTITQALLNHFPNSINLPFDDYFYDVGSDKHVIVPKVNHINFEILSSLDVNRYIADVTKAITESVLLNKKLVFLDGFLIFNEPRIAKLCDVKIFITIDKETCWARRSVRVYEPPDPPGYFDECVWPNYLKHFEEVTANVDKINFLNGCLDTTTLVKEAVGIVKKGLEEHS